MFGSNKKLKAEIADKDRAIASFNTRVAELEAEVAACRDAHDKVEQRATDMQLLLNDIGVKKNKRGSYLVHGMSNTKIGRRLYEWKMPDKEKNQ